MDTILVKDLVKHFIDEAFKQSPHNGSDGYQFAMGTVASFCAVFLVGFWIIYKDGRRDRRIESAERKQARIAAATQINGQFADIRQSLNEGLGEIEKEVDVDIRALQGQYAAIREELAGLKVKIDYLSNPKR